MFTKGERKHTQPDANGGVNVFTDEEHIAYFGSLGDALLDVAAPKLYGALKSLSLADIDPVYRQSIVAILALAEEV